MVNLSSQGNITLENASKHALGSTERSIYIEDKFNIDLLRLKEGICTLTEFTYYGYWTKIVHNQNIRIGKKIKLRMTTSRVMGEKLAKLCFYLCTLF